MSPTSSGRARDQTNRWRWRWRRPIGWRFPAISLPHEYPSVRSNYLLGAGLSALYALGQCRSRWKTPFFVSPLVFSRPSCVSQIRTKLTSTFRLFAGPLSPPRPPSGPSRSTSNYNYRDGAPPRGPASSSVPIRQPAGPGLATNGFDRSRRDVPVGSPFERVSKQESES